MVNAQPLPLWQIRGGGGIVTNHRFYLAVVVQTLSLSPDSFEVVRPYDGHR